MIKKLTRKFIKITIASLAVLIIVIVVGCRVLHKYTASYLYDKGLRTFIERIVMFVITLFGP